MGVRQIMVTIESPVEAYVRGYGSRELITELRRRPPIWAVSRRAWSCQAKTARDVIALAESRGYNVVVTREEAVSLADKVALDDQTPDRGMLW